MTRSILFPGFLMYVLLCAMALPAFAEKTQLPDLAQETTVDSGPAANELRAVRITPGKAVIETNGPVGKVKYFALQEPARLVVDVFGPRPVFEERQFPAGQGFEKIRLGTYSDKTRLVFDASESVLPQHNVEERATGILVTWVAAGAAEQLPTGLAGQDPPAKNQAVSPAAAPALQTFASAAAASLTEPSEREGQAVATDTRLYSGIEAGSLSLLPELAVSGVYDDNIFATRTDTVADRVLHLLPSLEIKSRWSKHDFGLSLGADIARYDKYSDEDFEDYWATADGRYDVTETLNFFGGIGYSREHEERGSPEDQNGTEPTIYSSLAAHLGSEISVDKLKFRFGGTYEELDFDDVGSSLGVDINNDDRDREMWGAGARISYGWSEQVQLLAQYIYDERNYDVRVDDYGYRRDSDGYRLAAGLRYVKDSTLAAEIYAGAMRQDYDDARFSTIKEPDFGAEINWQPSPTIRINGVIERSIEETTLAGSPGYLETRYAMHLDHNLTRRTSLRGHLQFSEYDYQEVPREDKEIGAGLGLQYDLTRNLFLGADYSFSHRNSNVERDSPDDNDYYRHRFMVSLGARLYPVKDDPLKGFNKALAELDAINEPPRGFYLGGLLSYGALATRARENRQHGGSSRADFGGDGMAGGIFTGYGMTHDRWVFGLEVEAEDSSLEWQHDKDKIESRNFSVKQNEGLGASLRLGYTMLDGSILYSRIGVMKTRFESFYRINEFPGDAYSETETLTGLRLGVGLDVPLSPQWFWRMETTYTDYESYSVKTPVFDEEFETEAHFFSAGIGWRFDAANGPEHVTPSEDPAGPYAGAQVGYGTLSTEVEGLHNEAGGSGTGPYAYQSDFAGQGVHSGLFVGYGWLFDRIYAGVELEAEVNGMEWYRERETEGSGGRRFSVEVKEGYGASARLGYQFRTGTLAYLRAGVVSSKFITRYAKGGNRAYDIYDDDYLDGFRYGAGLEAPVTSRVFVRLEFTHTEYDDYNVTTAHTNSDQMDFEPVQELARLGILYRF